MRGSRVLVALVVAGLALALVAIAVSGAAAQETAIGQDTAPLAPAATIVVTSTADSGPGTLRQALIDAAISDTIGFDTGVFPLGNPQTITLSSALPEIITDNLTIDASTAGVILDGSGVGSGSGLLITSDGNSVKGLHVLNFPGDGIRIYGGARSNVIGGSNASPGGACTGSCNIISGNGQHGVLISGSNVTTNTVSGNYVGVNASGTAAIPNGGSGVALLNGASYNTVGGDSAGERNIIGGNYGEGILLYGTDVVSNVICGNYIGTNATGTAPIGNDGGGIDVHTAAYTVIGGNNASPGGYCTGECNLISGNTGDNGISIFDNGAVHNTVSGNYIGTNVDGTAALGNTNGGILIRTDAQYNIIGGDTPGERNIISGNGGNGISIFDNGAAHNTVSGNYIGTDANGTAAIPNGHGVMIASGATYNVIGGNTIGERNLISGNDSNGVLLQGSGTMSNTASGNYIGTNISGTVALGNLWDGVWIGQEASHNTIGGTTAGERNLISGNRRVGVSINGQGNGASYNVIQGNYVGTDVSGTAALGNGWGDPYTGVEIYYAADNTIADNLVSGNHGNGIHIQGDTASGNQVEGNLIGTNVTGSAALGNGTTTGGWGVVIANNASTNTIGGPTTAEHNLVSGNGDLFCGPPHLAHAEGGGVAIWGGSYDNVVQGNTIGMDSTGLTPIPNAMAGVEIEGASGNLIGGTAPGAGNLISGNSCGGPPPPRAGIRLAGDDNTIQGNTIGPDVNGADITSMYDNGWTGIWIVAAGNLVEDNLIVGNAAPDGTGIAVWNTSALGNTLTENGIYGHGDKGISLEDGGNNYMFPPLLTEVTASGVKGTAVPNATVEVFSDDDDEGRWYHGYTVADGSGAFTFTAAAAFTGTNVTATATDQDGSTSEFSSPYHPSRDVVAAAVYVPQQRHKVNEPITPTVRVGNGGTTAETFTVTAVITRSSNGAQVYSHTQTVVDLGVFHYRTLALDSWMPVDSGGYTFELALEAATPDDNTTNDRLTLSFIASDDRLDVWARDNLSDNGQEPSSGPVWQSPDIWVRNIPDGGTTHQDPINATINTVYVTMRNRGTLTATNVAATVYWHPPSLVIGQSWWQPIGAVTVTQLAPEAAQVVSMSWPLNVSGMTGSYHTCLLGVITTTQDMAPATWDVASSNNLIQRNVDVIPQQANGSGLAFATSADVDSTFSIGNPYAAEQLADVIVDASDVPVTAELRIDLGDLYARWEQIGQGTLVGAAHISGTTVITIAGGTDAEITGIPLTGEELAGIAVEIYGMDSERATQVDVSERIGEDVLGGMTLDVTAVEYKSYLPLVLRAY